MLTQKAWRLHSYGGPECMQLDDVPIPEPGPLQALVSVSKVGVNPFDFKIREGYARDQLPLDLPSTLGIDFVGTVVRLGDKASRVKVGDRVMTMSRNLGAYAEHIAVEEDILALVPSSLDDIHAATLPIPALTAWQCLYAAGEIQPGMTIVIHGASGTVGSFAVQFAKSAGAKVIGTASGKNREYVMGLGADQFIDYQTESFEEILSDIDLVLDFVLVGGDRDNTLRSWKILKPNGAIVSGADPGVLSQIPAGYRGFFLQTHPDVPVLEMIARQLADSEIKAKVGKVFPRGELTKAMQLNQAGGTAGRLILDFNTA